MQDAPWRMATALRLPPDAGPRAKGTFKHVGGGEERSRLGRSSATF